MYRQLLAIGLCILSILALSGDCLAAGKSGVVNYRQQTQKSRIQQGVKSGELTKLEARRLAKEQRMVNRYEQKARSDGKISGREYVKLQTMQNHASQSIFKQKHDGQDRNP
jgi:hypothetical protein